MVVPAQTKIKDADGADRLINSPLPPSRAPAAESRPVVLSNEDLAAITAIAEKLSADPATQTTLAAILGALGETLTVAGTVNANLPAGLALESKQDAMVTSLGAILAALTSVAVTGPLTNTQLRGSAVPVTVAGVSTEATLASILAKIIAAPATEAKQDALNAKDFATQTTLAAILSKMIAAPATEAKQDALNAKDFATQTTLAAILNKIIAAPATEAKQDTLNSRIGDLTAGEYETVAASSTDQVMGAAGAAGDYLAGVLIIPATTSPGAVSIKDGGGGAITIFAGGASSVSNLVPFLVPLGIKAATAWKISTGANVSAIGIGNFT